MGNLERSRWEFKRKEARDIGAGTLIPRQDLAYSRHDI